MLFNAYIFPTVAEKCSSDMQELGKKQLFDPVSQHYMS